MSKTAPERSPEHVQSLLDTVERLRREKYSHLDAGLVRELLRLHADAGATDAELARGAEQAVERRFGKEKA
jgi:hypothetical protein